MRYINKITGLVFLGIVLVFMAGPAAEGAESIYKVSGSTNGWRVSPNFALIGGRRGKAHGLQMVLKNVKRTGINPSCKFEIYDTYGRFLWRGPTFSSDYTLSWNDYFIWRDGKRYYKDETDPDWTLEGIKIKALIHRATANMEFFLLY